MYGGNDDVMFAACGMMTSQTQEQLISITFRKIYEYLLTVLTVVDLRNVFPTHFSTADQRPEAEEIVT